MNSPRPSLVLFGYGFLIVGAIVFMGVSLGTNYWIEIDYNGLKINGGLFESCITDSNKCTTYAEAKKRINSAGTRTGIKSIEVCQGLCITAVVLEALTILVMGHLAFLVFGMNKELQSKNHGVITLLIGCLAGGLAVTGGIYFVIDSGTPPLFTDISWSFGYSMYFAILSGGLSFAAVTLAIIANAQLHKTQPPQMLQMQPQVIGGPPLQMGAPMTYVHAPPPHYQPAGSQPMPMYNVNPHPGQMAPQPNAVVGNQSMPMLYVNPHQGQVAAPQPNVVDEKAPPDN